MCIQYDTSVSSYRVLAVVIVYNLTLFFRTILVRKDNTNGAHHLEAKLIIYPLAELLKKMLKPVNQEHAVMYFL